VWLSVAAVPFEPVKAHAGLHAAQQATGRVKGRITDTTGEPLPGATVQLTGTTRGVIADENGNYEFTDVPTGATLVISYIGMETKAVLYQDQKELNIVLEMKIDELAEVSVVAFARQKKESVIGSITTVKPADLKIPSSNLTTALAGRIAGLVSYQRSGEPGRDNA
jgi:hypothetical protein